MFCRKFGFAFLLFLVGLLNSFEIRSQISDVNTMPNIGSLIPPSPNATAIAKYGEVPVSYYTGIPNISVPIYEIKTGSLDLPITLSYHAGGVRVEEIASWVGTGWNLNAGGAIVRQVRGIADEGDGGYLTDYHTLNQLLNGSLSSADQLTFFQNIEKGRADAEQDIFTYNTGSESGKFILDSSGTSVTLTASRNIFQLVTYNGTPYCWKMTDTRGIQYFFANKETTTTTPVTNNTLSPTALPSTVTSWYLSKIVNAQGTDSINLIYTLSVVHSNSSVAQTEYLYSQSASSGEIGLCGGRTPDSKYSSSTVTGWRLSQIIFKNGVIKLTPNTQSRCDLTTDYAISSIEVTNTDSSFDKIFRFYQHYISSTGSVLCDLSDEEKNRLFLDSVKISDAAGDNGGKYGFSYNMAVTLPSRLSYDQDYWGYYNDGQNNGNFVPAKDITDPVTGAVSHIPGANRNPDSRFNQAGILQTITYPTGGSTVFEYESNTASNYANTSGAGDVIVGTRVFVVGSAGPFKHMDTTFTINDDFNGLGGVNASISINNGGGVCAQGSNLSCPIVNMTGPTVVGAVYTNSNQFLKKGTYTVSIDLRTVTDQSIINNFNFGIIWSYGASSVDSLKYNMQVGGLRIKRITDYAANSSATNVRSYKYLFPDSAYYSSGFMLGFPQYSGVMKLYKSDANNDGQESAGCVYNTYSSNSNYPLASTQSSYVGYKYVQELLGANGEFGKNVYQFTAPDVIKDLGNVNIAPYPPATSEDWERGQSVHAQSYRLNTLTGQYELTNEKISQYQPLTTNIYSGYHVIRNIFYSGAVQDGLGLGDYQYSLFNTQAGWIPMINDTSRLYDQNNLSLYNQKTTAYTYSNVHFQPISIQTNLSNGETRTTYMSYPLDYTGLTGTDAFTKGIAALQNNNIITPVIEKYSQLQSPSGVLIGTTNAQLTSFKSSYMLPDTIWSTQFTAPYTSFVPLNVSGGSLIKDLNYVPQVAEVRYDANSNPAELQKLNDIRQSYIWDYLGTYPICKAVNADSTSIAFTSFEADGTGNWSIPSFIRDSLNAITGKKSYNLTNGSISKTGLSSGKIYLVTYWSKNGSYGIGGGTVSTRTGRSVNGWTYFEHTVTASSATITITGSGNIDELRLFPQGAMMTTYTYSPLLGQTSMADANGEITYYEYDGLQRLKNVKDYQGNIIKNYQYNYGNSCGTNCSVLPMQTMNGTNTISYPVGVFNVNGTLLGNATTQAQYITLWMADTADSHTGTIVAGSDSMHFNFTLNSGRLVPSALKGCRYYQYDFNGSAFNGTLYPTNIIPPYGSPPNGIYINFGDGTSMSLYSSSQYDSVYSHFYTDTSTKIITIYHNDLNEDPAIYSSRYPPTTELFLKNVRGTYPQNMEQLDPWSYTHASALDISNIVNWYQINSIKDFYLESGYNTYPCGKLNFPQDFMKSNKNLEVIDLYTSAFNYESPGYVDSTFKISKLKSDWNTYFKNLSDIWISDYQWNREDLTALTNLDFFILIADNQHHDNTSNIPIPIPSSVIDNIINQIASGAGRTVTNGYIMILSGGTDRTSASDAAYNFLISQGWDVDVQH